MKEIQISLRQARAISRIISSYQGCLEQVIDAQVSLKEMDAMIGSESAQPLFGKTIRRALANEKRRWREAENIQMFLCDEGIWKK
jgi:hypothetical protein